MKIKSIEAFVATVEGGSIHAAARDMGLSQPAISKTLKALEEELGVPLLTRGTRGVYLTDYGKRFFQRAKTILQESQKAISELEQMQGKTNSKISILLSPAASMQLAPTVLRQFRYQHPNVKIHIFEGLAPLAIEKLRTSEVDFAICAATENRVPKNEFELAPVMDVPMAIIGRAGHPLVASESLKELQQASWVQIGAGGNLTPLIHDYFIQNQLNAPDIAVECHSFTSSLAMILNTDLLGMVPVAWINNPIYRTQFSQIHVKEGGISNRLQLVLSRDKPLTPIASKLAFHFKRQSEHGPVARW